MSNVQIRSIPKEEAPAISDAISNSVATINGAKLANFVDRERADVVVVSIYVNPTQVPFTGL